ncbi:putative DNA internalization competence protein ComEC/Rec2 [Rhodococcus sp. AW25M09]|uniref:ComEC/Rec2 family competence protein n=1 Tax=Rhodococcus sp. AW25M09 TaxID=1268303 RepID=UPI0002AC8F61|nr:ComEC/Rec2 family competence protein [Rhodococcus sp. AW25M09]CCQ16010.1 putative DNA internalization competence protein ComEC/Rec2 [Rhodococcus sp. AW25M09]
MPSTAQASAAPTEEFLPFDVRLVPAAVVCWSITAVGILGGPGGALVATASTGTVVLFGSWALHLVAARRTATGPSWAGVATVVMLALCFGAAIWLQMRAVAEHPVAAAAENRAWITASVRLEEDPRRLSSAGPSMVLVKAELDRVDLVGTALFVGGRVSIIAPESSWSALLPGQEITVRGRLGEPSRPDMTVAVIRTSAPPVTVAEPGTISAAAGTFRTDLTAVAQNSMPPDRAGLLPGLVVGDISRMDETVAENFRAAGLTHLTAVSGANFSILIGAVLLVLRGVGIGPRATVVVAFVVLVAFVIVARPSPSVLRAAVMGSIGLLALVTGRRRQAVPALCGAVLALLAWWPRLAVDVGFVLSVFATAGLVLVAPIWVDWLRGHGWPRTAAEVVAVAAAAHAVTAPVVAAMAGTFSVVGVAANVLVAPVVAPITVVGIVTAVIATVSTSLAELTAQLASAPLWWLIAVAERAASVPAAGIVTPGGLWGAVLTLCGTAALLASLRLKVIRWIAAAVSLAALALWTADVLW